jgi:hypothetical protein
MKRYESPAVIATYRAADLRTEASMVAVASTVGTTTVKVD